MSEGVIWRLKCDRCENTVEKPYSELGQGMLMPVPDGWSRTTIKIYGKSEKRIHMCPICSEFLDVFFPDAGQPVLRAYAPYLDKAAAGNTLARISPNPPVLGGALGVWAGFDSGHRDDAAAPDHEMI